MTHSDNKNISVTLTVSRVAPLVWLETNVDGLFSDNGFTVIQNSVEVTFSNKGQEIDVDEFKKTLKVLTPRSADNSDKIVKVV